MRPTEGEILDFLQRYENATNTHDFLNVAPFIHPNAIFRFNDGDFVGLQEIKDAFVSTWQRIKNETYFIRNVTVVSIDSNSAVVSYNFHWVGMVEGGQSSGNGRGTNVLVRNEEGKLSVAYEHLSK